jgi:uncharacterized membrane protein YfcA
LVTVFFYRRRRSGPDRFLAVKLATFILGAVLGLVGMRIDKPFLVGVAIGVVLVGVLLRLVSQRSDAAVKDREQRVP